MRLHEEVDISCQCLDQVFARIEKSMFKREGCMINNNLDHLLQMNVEYGDADDWSPSPSQWLHFASFKCSKPQQLLI